MRLQFSVGNKSTLDYDWFRMYQRYLEIVVPGDRVLEIGASNVARTRQLAAACSSFVGVEYFQERLLPSTGNMCFIRGDWQHLSEVLPPESIDVAIASHVIEHILDDAVAINELHVVLRPGGKAIINTPNRKRLPRAAIELVTGDKRFPCGEHAREYLEADLTRLLQDSPFRHFRIDAVTFGIHSGPLKLYIDEVPR
ncbi:MAG: class I SAM-dependent methyltransferase, partial [Thiobacillus sp.]